MKYIKYSKNKKKLWELVENDKKFSHMNRRTAILLNECTHSELKFYNPKGEIDMCQAIKDIRQEGKEEGREEGRKEERKEAVRALMKNMGLTVEQAMKILNIPSME